MHRHRVCLHAALPLQPGLLPSLATIASKLLATFLTKLLMSTLHTPTALTPPIPRGKGQLLMSTLRQRLLLSFPGEKDSF